MITNFQLKFLKPSSFFQVVFLWFLARFFSFRNLNIASSVYVSKNLNPHVLTFIFCQTFKNTYVQDSDLHHIVLTKAYMTSLWYIKGKIFEKIGEKEWILFALDTGISWSFLHIFSNLLLASIFTSPYFMLMMC